MHIQSLSTDVIVVNDSKFNLCLNVSSNLSSFYTDLFDHFGVLMPLFVVKINGQKHLLDGFKRFSYMSSKGVSNVPVCSFGFDSKVK